MAAAQLLLAAEARGGLGLLGSLDGHLLSPFPHSCQSRQRDTGQNSSSGSSLARAFVVLPLSFFFKKCIECTVLFGA